MRTAETWFTSDTHWGHANIIEYCSRPFADCAAMDEQLIENWNAIVHPGDAVYHLGDFAITWHRRDSNKVTELARRLNGVIHLVYGNHDRQAVKDAGGFAWKGEYKRIKVGDQSIVLFHYPIMSWHGIARGAWHLHGHCHGNLCDTMQAKRFDVGVDCWNYRPINFETVKTEMAKRVFIPVDHHAEV